MNWHEAGACAHRWTRGTSDLLRYVFRATLRWLDYEYCDRCRSFRDINHGGGS